MRPKADLGCLERTGRLTSALKALMRQMPLIFSNRLIGPPGPLVVINGPKNREAHRAILSEDCDQKRKSKK